jgi:PAS domain S-box-containing protein
VLAAYRRVAGSDWHMVSKIDVAEVLAPMWRTFRWIVGVTAIAAFAVFWAFARMLRQQAQLKDLETQAQTAQLYRQLQSLGDNLPQGFIYQYSVSPNGAARFNYVSAGIEQVTGFTPAQALADAGAVFSLAEPEALARYQEDEARSAREMSTFQGVVKFRHPNGQRRWLEIKSMPHRGADGEIQWDGIVLDVTAAKQAELERLNLLKIISDSPDYIGMADLEGRLLYHNRAARRMLGLADDADVSALKIGNVHPAWGVKLVLEEGRNRPSSLQSSVGSLPCASAAPPFSRCALARWRR